MQSIHHTPAQSASNPHTAHTSPRVFLNRPKDDATDQIALLDSLQQQGFTGLFVNSTIIVTFSEDVAMSRWVMVSLDVKQYENEVGRMVYSCVTNNDLGGHMPQILDEIRGATRVLNGIWLATEATMERPPALGYGMILNPDADESEVKAVVLEVAREANRGAGIVAKWLSRAAAGGSVSFAL